MKAYRPFSLYRDGEVERHYGQFRLSGADFAVLLAVALAAAYWIGVLVLNLPSSRVDFLIMASGDDLSFYQVVLRMYDALLGLDTRNFFNISFQSYGMAYFVAQVAAAAPAFAMESWDAAALILRMLPATWAAGSVVLAAAFVRRVSPSPVAPLIAAALLVATPGFWTNALWNHPDHMMAFFLLATFYRAAGAEGRPASRDLLAIAALFALAMSSKFQAVLAAPAMALYVAWPVLADLEPSAGSRLRLSVRILAVLFVMTLGLFVLFNPYLLHPLGFGAFYEDLWRNIESNRTNHGAYTVPTLGEKLAVIGTYYLGAVEGAVFAVAALVGAWGGAPDGRRVRAAAGGAVVFLVAGGMALAANKAWESYYVMPFVFLLVCGGALTPSPARRRRAHLVVLVLFAGVTAASAFRLPDAVMTANYAALDTTATMREADALTATLSGLLEDGETALVSPRTPIPFAALDLRPDAVRVIDGSRLADYMKNATYVILRKDDMYFDDALYADLVRRDLPHRARMEEVRSLVFGMLAGEHPDFGRCRESERLYVFCRRDDPAMREKEGGK